MKVHVGDTVCFELPNQLRFEASGDQFAVPRRPRTLQFIVTADMLRKVQAPARRRARARRKA